MSNTVKMWVSTPPPRTSTQPRVIHRRDSMIPHLLSLSRRSPCEARTYTHPQLLAVETSLRRPVPRTACRAIAIGHHHNRSLSAFQQFKGLSSPTSRLTDDRKGGVRPLRLCARYSRSVRGPHTPAHDHLDHSIALSSAGGLALSLSTTRSSLLLLLPSGGLSRLYQGSSSRSFNFPLSASSHSHHYSSRGSSR